MKKILVASDFSTCAGNALQYAIELAKILSLEVSVIHAISPTEGINNNTYNALYIEDYYNSKREALATWTKTYTEAFPTIELSTTCEVGSLASVITKYMEANPVELLVMGTMGSTGISGLFGSNASMMVEKTKTPTLIIPLESKFSVNAVITLATDFSTHLSPEDIAGMNELLTAMGTKKLNVINIVEGNDWKTNEPGEEKLKSMIPHTELDFKYIAENSTLDGILNFVVSSQTDILCLVKHHHNLVYRIFNRSTVNKVLSRPLNAVLVLHE